MKNKTILLLVFIVSLFTLPISSTYAACTKTGALGSGHSLLPGQTVCSPNGQNKLACQADGNLVFYINGKAGFRSNTHGQQIKGCFMQKDGNLVVYRNDNKPIWNSGTHTSPGAQLSVRDDGMIWMHDAQHLVIRIYSKECNFRMNPGEVLAPGQSICSQNGQHIMACQADGNMVLYHNGKPAFNTGTHGNAIKGCFMQGDGNLVVYNTSMKPLWNAGTHNNPEAYLTLYDNGSLMLTAKNGTQLKAYK